MKRRDVTHIKPRKRSDYYIPPTVAAAPEPVAMPSIDSVKGLEIAQAAADLVVQAVRAAGLTDWEFDGSELPELVEKILPTSRHRTYVDSGHTARTREILALKAPRFSAPAPAPALAPSGSYVAPMPTYGREDGE